MLLDAAFADPARFHPVAGFGRAACRVERALYRDSRTAGAAFTLTCVGTVAALSAIVRPRGTAEAVTVAAATWVVLGGTSLRRHGRRLAGELANGDVTAARDRLPSLCGRDPSHLGSDDLARAGVESLAENTSDAVVAPLLWGAVAGVPGLLAYRAINTLDAMVGHRSERYERFGWAAARLDDAANLAPARLAAALTCVCAPLVHGSPRTAWRIARRDGGRHPSPNAGPVEAAFAGALGLRLGGEIRYPYGTQTRPVLGDGRTATADDLTRAARLSAAVTAATLLVMILAVLR